MTLPRERQASKRVERQKLIQDIKQQNPEITDEQLSKYDIDDLRKIRDANASFQRVSKESLGMQQGGMADMSAAPMIKQPQTKKRRAASGFRTKYSKGGGVRASKYKL